VRQTKVLSEVNNIATLAAYRTDLQKKSQVAATFREGAILTIPNRAKLRNFFDSGPNKKFLSLVNGTLTLADQTTRKNT
jgi:hypothetical protein